MDRSACHGTDVYKRQILLFLPQAHSFARAINYIVVSSNVRIYIATGIKTLISDLQVAKPTLMIVVPRVLETVSYTHLSFMVPSGPSPAAAASAPPPKPPAKTESSGRFMA